MKRTISLVIISLLCAQMFCTFVPHAKAQETAIFQDDFETYSIGAFPAGGWDLTFNGAGNQYQVITDSYSHSFTKSLQLLGQDSWTALANRGFSHAGYEIVGYEVYVMSPRSDCDAYVGFYNRNLGTWGTSFAAVGIRYGVIGQSGFNVSFAPNTWYKIRVEEDKSSRLWSFWVNDLLVGQNLAEASDPSQVLTFEAASGWTGTLVYFDDVKVFGVGGQSLRSGLVGYWDFDEGSGSTAADRSGNGNTGMLVNGPAWGDGKCAKALSFDGASNYVQIPDSSSLDVTAQVTVEAWINVRAYVDSSGWNPHIVSRCATNGGTIYVLGIYLNSSKVMYGVNQSPDIPSSNTSLTLDTWIHLAMTYDGSYVSLYVDGEFDSGYAQSGPIETTDNQLTIGVNSYPAVTYSYFNGTIDEVRIYNRALSQPEIRADMNAHTCGTITQYSWSMFHHDLGHTGYTESPAPYTNQTLWNFTTASGVFSSPAVADGKVYVGSLDNKTYCLDAATGALVWSYTTGSRVWSSPAVADGKVYIGSEDTRVYCLNAQTGTQVWNYTTGDLVWSSPAVADGKVYVGSYDNKTYCLDASTGAHIWNYTTGYVVTSSPAVADGRVYVGSDEGKVYCLDALTGAYIWNYTTYLPVCSSPSVADGRVYVGSDDNKTYCLDALTGAHIWNYTTGYLVWSSPAVADGKVYVGSYDNKTYCLDASTGAHIWNYTTGDWVISSPAVADGKVYVESYDNKTYCLDAATGTLVWSYTTGSWMPSSPAVADGVVYVGSYDRNVYAFGNVTRVPEDYKTVQEAIDAAPPNATIWIAPGIYNESLVVNKTLTLIGKIGSSPIFRGGGSGTAIILLPAASGSIIAGIVITNWNRGILLANSTDCKIYNNIMSSMNGNGIVIEGSNASNNVVYGNLFEGNGLAINLTDSSAGNTVYKNVITSNSIGLKVESDGNAICANSIIQNGLGLSVTASDNLIYHNNFIGNTEQVYLSESAIETWDDGYPSGGNYWNLQSPVDRYGGPNQNEPYSDSIVDTQYTVAVNNLDRYPLLQPFDEHDIGIVSVTTPRTIIVQGSAVGIEVKILNYGAYDETFTVTFYANATTIGKLTATIVTRNSTTILFTWNTIGVSKDFYVISAIAETLQKETETADNGMRGSTVRVTVCGDITGDGICDMQDISILIDKFMANPSDPRWNDIQYPGPNCDINNDLTIDMADISIAIDHFMQT